MSVNHFMLFCVYMTIIISTIVDKDSLTEACRVYMTIIISTIVDASVVVNVCLWSI